MKKYKTPLTLLLILNLFLLLPSLFEPISYGDECIYLTLGNAFRKGLIFYRDIHDNKPPMLYLLAAASFGRLYLFRLFSIICNLVHLSIIYLFIKKLTSSKLVAFLGGIIFTFLLLIFEGRIANGEVFMATMATLATYLLFNNPKKNIFSFGVIIGFLFSLGFLFKIPIAFDFVGILFAFFFLPLKSLSKKEFAKIFKNKKLWGIITGFTTPIVVSIIYYWGKGAFTPYVRSALMQNIGYLSSWQGSNAGLIMRMITLIAVSLFLFIYRKRLHFQSGFFFIWFIFALFGALLSERPYPHYLIEIVPPLVLLVTVALNNLIPNQKRKSKLVFFKSQILLIKSWPVILSASAIILLVTSFSYFRFWWYPQLSYYQNFFHYLTQKINREEYYSYWGEKTSRDYQLASFITKTALPEERTFVWGDAACIYAITNRPPPGRYTVNYHIFDFNGFEETLAAIKKHQPRLIIKLKEERRHWPELDSHLNDNYYPFYLDKNEDKIFLRKSVPVLRQP